MKPGTSKKLGLLVLLFALFVGVQNLHHLPAAFRQEPAQRPPPVLAREAGPAELALVAPLAKGGKLLEYDIKAIYGVDPGGALWVVLAKEQAQVHLTVAMASDAGALAPVVVNGQYAIFYSAPQALQADAARLMGALSETIKANAAVAMPPGLGPFKPGALPAPPT